MDETAVTTVQKTCRESWDAKKSTRLDQFQVVKEGLTPPSFAVVMQPDISSLL